LALRSSQAHNYAATLANNERALPGGWVNNKARVGEMPHYWSKGVSENLDENGT
jgi:hypothetical protein